MVIDGPKIPLRRKCKTNQQKCFAHIWDSIYIKRQINYCLKSYKNRLKTDVLRRFLVRVGRLELPASCSQSKRATNCATPGYGIALSVAFHVVLVVFWPPALRKWFPLLVVSQRVVGLGFFPHGWAGYAPKSRALPTALHPDIQFFCMIPCGEEKSKFFVSVGGAVVKPDFAGIFQPGNFRHKLLSQGLPGFRFQGNG